ncbi:MAG: glutamate-5-semialdehyde dehydrogenase [Candidatus Protochlamydia sp.]|nr:glutamate-5-semialdehyde dehydrogenase [Candidatus Protochlamydia sp.]
MKTDVLKMAKAAKNLTFQMAATTLAQRNGALEAIRRSLKNKQEDILKANSYDLALAAQNGLNEAMLERLSLENKLDGIIHDIGQVIQLPDPIGEVFEEIDLPNQLHLAKYRTPIGVLGIIYESRPNVTIDISSLIIKSGNCALLRGGSETLSTNKVLVEIIQSALKYVEMPSKAIQLIGSSDRLQVKELLQLHDYIDLIIPRGSASLQEFCRKNSTIPVITGGIGICHLFVDQSADLDRSLNVILNAKIQRPTVCNSLDTLLVHSAVALGFIPKVIKALGANNVTFRLDQAAWDIAQSPSCKPAELDDWDTEWLSLVLGIKVVNDLSEAIEHIHLHSTKHSDGILTEDHQNAGRFIKEIDSAAVYVNASTRFTDGGQFGFGAEVAISTQKLHARGPMGLKELTSYKWVVKGDYQVRPQ